MNRNVRSGVRLLSLIAGAWLLLPGDAVLRAQAQDAEPVSADQLFEDGKARMANGNYVEACPLFAASHAAEPATGAVLALAVCHERAGKLESARRTYAEAAERSKAEQNAEREQAARAKVESLTALRSTVEITLGFEAPGVEVSLDGERLQAEQLGTPIGVDGGSHLLEVAAPGKQPYRAELRIGEQADHQRILVGALGEQPGPEPTVTAKAKSPRPPRKWSPETWIGVATAGAGVVALAIGTGLAISGGNGNDRAADAAGLYFVLGGVLTVTGALVFLATAPLGSDGPSDSAAVRTPSVQVGGWLLPRSAGVGASGRF